MTFTEKYRSELSTTPGKCFCGSTETKPVCVKIPSTVDTYFGGVFYMCKTCRNDDSHRGRWRYAHPGDRY